MAYALAVLGGDECTDEARSPTAVVCVFGLYDTIGEARTAVQSLLGE